MADIVTAVTEVKATADAILEIIGNAAPSVAGEAAIAESTLDLIADLITKAITAYNSASSTPITVASIAELMPSATALTAPDAA
jgi:hypothetical protein